MPSFTCLAVSVAMTIASKAMAMSFSADSPTALAPPGYRLRPFDPDRERDRSSLEEICANIYGGSDYLPKMAPTYAADPACSFLALARTDSHDRTEDEDEDILAVANYKRLPAHDSAWIEAVRTHPDHRKQGLASALLRSMVAMSKREGVADLLTCTIRSNRGMLRALEKEGFVQCNTIQMIKFDRLRGLPGWSAKCSEVPRPLLSALNLEHEVSPAAKQIPALSWRRVSDEQQLLGKLRECQIKGGTCGYLPGLYEYIVPGPNRDDLKRSMERGLVLTLDVLYDKEMSNCEGVEGGELGHAVMALTLDERITTLKSKWVCSIVAHTQLAFEAALWHAHSRDVATRMHSFQQKHGEHCIGENNMNGSNSPPPFVLAFDDAVPLVPGSLAHMLPRVSDECVVFSYQLEGIV
ncbi:hypothetical protein ACHAWF_002728 [Thalassiosira exigua]